MPDRLAIYRNDAKTYDLLISREDNEGNLLKSLQDICDFSGKDIADLGAGTGRLAHLLSPYIRSALLTDNAGPMLDVAKERLTAKGFTQFTTHVCDISTVPAEDASFDIVLAGWALISVALRSDPWPEAVKKALSEMQRVLRSGGTIILIESMGTGQEKPKPPNQRFADYFKLLEDDGFQRQAIRTDYKFASLEEKEKLLTFFFDKEMLDVGVKNDSLTYPECTGIWWKKI